MHLKASCSEKVAGNDDGAARGTRYLQLLIKSVVCFKCFPDHGFLYSLTPNL